jgi:hypothetical protein
MIVQLDAAVFAGHTGALSAVLVAPSSMTLAAALPALMLAKSPQAVAARRKVRLMSNIEHHASVAVALGNGPDTMI